MAIRVQHGTSPTAALHAAFGAGAGQTRQRAALAGAQAAAAGGRQRRQMLHERAMLERRLEAMKPPEPEAPERERFGLHLPMGRREREEFAASRALPEPEMDLRFTAQQRADQERLRDGRYEFLKSEAYTDEEKAEGLPVYDDLLGPADTPTPVPKEPEPTNEDLLQASMATDPDTKEPYIKDRHGEWKPKYSSTDKAKFWDLAIKRATTTDADGNETYDDAKAERYYTSMTGLRPPTAGAEDAGAAGALSHREIEGIRGTDVEPGVEDPRDPIDRAMEAALMPDTEGVASGPSAVVETGLSLPMKPPEIAANPRESKEWDKSAKLMARSHGWMTRLAGDPEAPQERKTRDPEDVSDLATAQWQLAMLKKDLEEYESTGRTLFATDLFGPATPGATEWKENRKDLRDRIAAMQARADELKDQVDKAAAINLIHANALEKMGRR